MQASKCSNCRRLSRPNQLYRCCNPMISLCQACRSKINCLRCSHPYPKKPMSSLHPKVPQVPKVSKCSLCNGRSLICICTLFSKNKGLERCDMCKKDSKIADTFCNVNCGHIYCKRCFKVGSLECFCKAAVDLDSAKVFWEICQGCKTPLNGSKNYGGKEISAVCKKCFQASVQSYSQFTVQQVKLNKEALEVCKESLEELRCNKPTQNPIFSPPRTPSPFKKSSPNETPGHNVSIQSCSAPAKLSKADQAFCSLCNIGHPQNLLFSIPKCLQKHSTCRVCLLDMNRIRKADVCRRCKTQKQEEMARKLTYRELNAEQREQYCSHLQEGYNICVRCSAMIHSIDMYTVGGRLRCRMCVTMDLK